MKKISLIIVALMLVCVLVCGCSSTPTFMSTKDYATANSKGNPTMEMTVEYTVNSTDVQLVLTYELLMDKTPITVCNFIKNVNDGVYSNTMLSSRSTSPAYLMGGAYKCEDLTASSKVYSSISIDSTIKGEFKANNYSEPEDGYAENSMFALAMYHTASTSELDSASTKFLLTTSTSAYVSGDDYAVFASLKTIKYSIKVDDDYVEQSTSSVVPAIVVENLTSNLTTTTVTYDETSASSLLLIYIPSIKILDKDGNAVDNGYWNYLPSYTIAK